MKYKYKLITLYRPDGYELHYRAEFDSVSKVENGNMLEFVDADEIRQQVNPDSRVKVVTNLPFVIREML